ncbi:unnamed protein product [Durusdinium trenchii]|uniref:Uncharacterized protein n=1 Tax=Durusdinium trenchii TaxID=1381693 RepID=A0ABP0SJX1_9DINO
MFGEALATFNADEVESKSVKSLKTELAKRIGVPRFRQRWFNEAGHELTDASVISADVQLIVLGFWATEGEHSCKLVSACSKNHWREVEEQLQLPVTPDAANKHGRTALHVAAVAGHEQCVSLLLEAAASCDKTDRFGQTALHLAAEKGHREVVQLLLQELGPLLYTSQLSMATGKFCGCCSKLLVIKIKPKRME